MADTILNGGAAKPVPPTLYDAVGRPLYRGDDVAWQPPADPIDKVDLGERARALSREIPIVVVATGWSVPAARRAMDDLVIGLFDAPAQMGDAMVRSDSRVQAALTSRLSIFGRPIDYRLPRRFRDSALAKECLDAYVDAQEEMNLDRIMSEVQRWNIILGWGPGQIMWDMSGEYAIPRPLSWHPRYTYYHWQYQCFVAITMDGQEPIVPGDGHWLLHSTVHEKSRPWMRGALSSVCPWWLARHFALRDWARFSERHGLPMIKLKTPSVGDPQQQALIRFQVANLGQETVFHLPQNPPPALSYDVDLMEARDTEHEGFLKLIQQCGEEIVLAMLSQQLTTSMPAEGGSSYAAARVHAGVLQGLLEADARGLSLTEHRDLARPFAAINFGNAALAPRVVRDVTPFEDAKTKAASFQAIATALNSMRTAGFKLNPRLVRRMIRETIPGFDPGRIEAVEPVQIEAQAARAGATVTPDGKSDASARERMPRIMSGMRFDPRTLDRVRIHMDEGSEELREAMAEIEAAHADRERAARRMRW